MACAHEAANGYGCELWIRMGLKKPADRMHRSDQLSSLDRGADNGERIGEPWSIRMTILLIVVVIVMIALAAEYR